MAQKVYVVLHDHVDGYSGEYEYQYSSSRVFVGVAATEQGARGILEEAVLCEYYHAYDGAEMAIANADYYSWYRMEDDILRFDVLKDDQNMIEVDYEGDTDTYYYEEFEI